ncbi:hypothetical protein [Pantoea phytobeneficialis]|uniref:Uncharacterized protein n=1 Tax=Pantoea phytobeneficialis TaxID=2052056 RepID=A0AAP9KRT4_9GAMM|nr:hypothetical protein [Pantoea phytobeneficialis]MDO6407506.1 hypothetical protein [Pantoea phytobeneficialis]QGR09446.1 hypothetical protein CTZ24_23520 [Pantoea phytobeneficialis]
MSVVTCSRSSHASVVFSATNNNASKLRSLTFVANTADAQYSGARITRQRSYSSPAQISGSLPESQASGGKDFIVIDIPDQETERPAVQSSHLLSNIGNVAARSLASVAVSTGVREVVRRVVLPAVAPATLSALAVGCGTVSLVMQGGALAWDCYQGRQTTQNVCARVGSILLAGGSMVGLVCSGGLSLAAAPLISAVVVYVPIRDFIQYFLPLRDNVTSEADFRAILSAAAAYAVNQTAVSLGMIKFADVLEPQLGPIAANIAAVTSLNFLGETAEELITRHIKAWYAGEPDLRIDLHPRCAEEVTWQSVCDTFTDPVAGRASLFTAGFANSFAIPGGDLAASGAVGLTLGVGFPLFTYSADHLPPSTPALSNRREITTIDIDYLSGEIL